ncbi:hypothetical protein AOQ84DRAFT_283289 [Glonium stellatum]|uniref:C2H2-type domain-containing protein n=1 Tax=Glonium stellatum TaxID=574774 RepID=A0A8E2F9Z6_9PEZI|nr:hypothetical protein AOQ84DRAFT_283289 [Glonium stellatum]
MPQFQRYIECPTLGQPSTYPSPARSDSDTVNYSSDGLGLYNYPLPLPSAQNNTALYPSSPQSTESWVTHFARKTSPLVTEAHADPWPSLYDPPVSRSPLAWNSAQNSPRDSDCHAISHRSPRSSYGASNYSQEEPETNFTPEVKAEPQQERRVEDESSSNRGIRHDVQTVSPQRLSTVAFPYSYAYDSPAFTGFGPQFEEQAELQERDIGLRNMVGRRRVPSRRGYTSGPTARMRIRRNPTTPENGHYVCPQCRRLFQRNYNLKSHLQTHDPKRAHPNLCTYAGCERRFVRRTDLSRHEKSVHLKVRNFNCSACDSNFARKDTLRRHEEDGCPRRFELIHKTLPPETTPNRRQPNSFGAHSSSPISPAAQTTPLFQG